VQVPKCIRASRPCTFIRNEFVDFRHACPVPEFPRTYSGVTPLDLQSNELIHVDVTQGRPLIQNRRYNDPVAIGSAEACAGSSGRRLRNWEHSLVGATRSRGRPWDGVAGNGPAVAGVDCAPPLCGAIPKNRVPPPAMQTVRPERTGRQEPMPRKSCTQIGDSQ